MLDQEQDVGRLGPDGGRRSANALYRRPMPGGGYVEVEMDATYDSTGATMRWHGRVIVERRSETSRRFGNEPPVVAAIDGDDAEELLADLFRLARDNAALARGLLRRQSTRLRAD